MHPIVTGSEAVFQEVDKLDVSQCILMRGLAHQMGLDSWCADTWRVYDEGVVRANTSHEEVPWLSEFSDCGRCLWHH